MPHKPGPPIIRIEQLSTGIDPTQRDDFTGALIPQPLARPPKIQDARAHNAALKEQERKDKHLALQALGIVPMTDPALLELRNARRAKRAEPFKRRV